MKTTENYEVKIHSEAYTFDTRSLLKVGDKFEITHIDGYVAKEEICKVKYDGYLGFYYTCESAACYHSNDLENEKYKAKKIN
jgi:hypothetical protein